MKLAFVVCNNFLLNELMALLRASEIDYYTRWDDVKGKGRGTEPHLGSGSFGSTNSVLMIAFDNEGPLETLTAKITAFNAVQKRSDDRVRVFLVPLDRIV
jgi:hypothetical protein